MKKYLQQLYEGIFTNNPVLVQLIGMCPTLATTTSLNNGIGMGLAATAVLICSNVGDLPAAQVHPLRRSASPAYVVVIAGFVTVGGPAAAGLSARPVRIPGPVHSPDRGQLHHPGPGGGLCLQKQACSGLRRGRSGHGPGLHLRPAASCPSIREILGSGTICGRLSVLGAELPSP